jgi:hypothetical protein
MKRKTRPRKGRKHVARQEEALHESQVVPAPPAPAGLPLTGEGLEKVVVDVLARPFRQTPERKAMRRDSNGADDDSIEAALMSPRVRGAMRPVAAAYLLEQSIVLLRLHYQAARIPLETDGNKSGQTAAQKSTSDFTVEPLARELAPSLPAAPTEVIFSSDFERSVIEDVLKHLRATHSVELNPQPNSEGSVMALPTAESKGNSQKEKPDDDIIGRAR